MAHLDLYANPDGPGWLLDLQSDLLDGMATRVVAPVMPADAAPRPAARLNPVVQVEGVDAVLVAQFLAAVPASILGAPVGSLAAERDAVTASLDMLFHGF